jgi:peptidyl-prolyl cis-trans isomerase D
MFRFMRRSAKLKKYLLIFFLGIVCVGMVLFLMPPPVSDSSQVTTNNLAEIGGRKITTAELRQSIDAQLRRSQSGYNPVLAQYYAQPILDEMIQREATLLEARKLGIVASQEEVMRAAQAIPGLYENGVFIGRDKFEQGMGMTLEQFEDQIRSSILSEKLQSVVTDGILATPAEVRAEFIRRNTKAQIQYVLFDPSQSIKTVDASQAALEAFYKKDPSRYKVPEERRVRYVLIDADRIRAQAKVSDDEITRYYNQHLSDYRVPDRVHVAHILFKTTGKTPAEVATIENTARDVLRQIKAGKDFGEMAKGKSEDSSAQKGGDIGWIVRGQTVKEFESAAFSMQPGQLSDLIKTTYGIHIIKVIERQDAHLQTLDEVKPEIGAQIEKEKIAQAQQNMGDDLGHRFRQDPKNFDAVARQAGLEVKETPLFKFKETVPDFGNSEAFANLAFQLHPTEVGDPINVPKGLAIIQLKEIVAEHLAKLEEVRAMVEQNYRADQSKVLAADKARQFAEKSKTQDFKAAAKSLGLTVKESKEFAQQDYVENVGPGSALADAFTLAPGQTSGVVVAGANTVVFNVMSHTAANEADLPKQQDQIAEELVDRKRTMAFEIYKKNLKQQLIASHELKVNDAAMKQFLATFARQS